MTVRGEQHEAAIGGHLERRFGRITRLLQDGVRPATLP